MILGLPFISGIRDLSILQNENFCCIAPFFKTAESRKAKLNKAYHPAILPQFNTNFLFLNAPTAVKGIHNASVFRIRRYAANRVFKGVNY